ncbi:MAG: kynureninase, partial [Gammaproteobacteria bacterium]|nr:kynureninase [Gammaproteobacteria bacterium]
LQLTGYLDWLVRRELDDVVEIITPPSRGCQLSLRLRQPEQGRQLQAQLIERGIICDWREPDVIRVAPVPMYNQYLDVYELIEALQALT